MKNRTSHQTTKSDAPPLTYEALAAMSYEEREAVLRNLRRDIENRLQPSSDSRSTTYFTKN